MNVLLSIFLLCTLSQYHGGDYPGENGKEPNGDDMKIQRCKLKIYWSDVKTYKPNRPKNRGLINP